MKPEQINQIEAVAARAAAQVEILNVIESMLDGDYSDAKHHLERWNEKRLIALQCEGRISLEVE